MAEPKKDKRESALPAVSPTAAIFLGVGAARTLADRGESRPLKAFQKADALRRKGASESAIYAATNKLLEGSPYAGISYDAARNPRFEISDHDAKIVPSGLNASGRGAMGDFLRHPELYKALPSAERLDVNKGGTQGNAAFDGRTVYLGDRNFADQMLAGRPRARQTVRGPLLHEIQHHGQDVGDRPRGASPEDFRSQHPGDSFEAKARRHLQYGRVAGEVESEVSRLSANMTPAERRAEHPNDRAKRFGLAARRDQIVMDRHGRIVEMADDLRDFGEKIGGARKDRAVKTGPKAAREPAKPEFPGKGERHVWDDKARAASAEVRAANAQPVAADTAKAAAIRERIQGAIKGSPEHAAALKEWSALPIETQRAAVQAAGDGAKPSAPAKTGIEVRDLGRGRYGVVENGQPVKDSKGNDKWFGSRSKAEAFAAKQSSVTKAPASVTRETGKTVVDQGKPLPSVTRNAGVRDAKVGDNAPPDLDRLTKAAERLEAVAQRTMQKAEAEANRPRLMNTARRARMGSGVIEQAQQEIADAKTALKIAEALRRGEAGALSNVKSLADIRELRRLAKEAEWATDRKEGRNWKPGGHGLKPDDVKNVGGAKGFVRMEPNTVEEIKTALKGKRGLGDAIRTLERYADGTRRNDRTNFETSDPKVFEAVRKVANEIRKAGGDNSLKWQAGKWLEEVRDFNRKVKLAGTDPNARQEALRAFMDVREGKAVPSPAAIAERNLIGMKLPGFFPTPESLAKRMADLADIQKGQMVLEPSAGTGRLADAAKARGATVDAVESQWTLRDILSKKGHNLVADDFTAMKLEPKYDRILMNPPFEKGQDMAHVQRAYDALKPGGKMVAVMGEGGFFRSDKQATEFRAWLEQVRGTSEKLPEGTFKESNTGVNTRLVVIEKPAAVAEAAMKAAATGERHVWDDKARAASAEVRAANAAPVEPGPAVKAARANDVNALAKALNTNATRAADVLKAYKKGRIDDAHLEKVTPRTRMVEMADAPKAAQGQSFAKAEIGHNQPRSVVQDIHPAADPKFTSIKLKIGDQEWSTAFRNEHPEGMLKHNIGSLRETYRKELAKRFNEASARGDTVDFSGVSLKTFGDDAERAAGGQKLGTVTLKPEHAGALDGARETTKGHGKRAWTAKAYAPDKLSFFGEVMPMTSKQAGIIAKALGMPSFKEVISEVDTAVKSAARLRSAPVAASKVKDPSIMSAVERATALSGLRGTQNPANLAAINANRAANAADPLSAAKAAMDAATEKAKASAAPKPPKGFDPKRSGMRFLGASSTMERGAVGVYLGKDGTAYVADAKAAMDVDGRPLGLRQAPAGIQMSAAKDAKDHRFHASAQKAPADSLARDFKPAAPTVSDLKAEAKAAGIKGASKMSKASLMEALGKNVNRIGMVGMVAAPVAAAMVAYDATKSSAHAAGTDGKTATMQAATAAAVAGGVTAGIGYGIGKGIGLTFKAAAAIAPKVAPMLGPAGIALGVGMMGYGAYHGYQKGGIKGAALGAIGADTLLDLGKSAPVTPTAAPEGTPRGVDATKASEFEARNTAYSAMQETARNVVEVNTFARERHTESGTVVKEVVKAYTRARPNQ